MIPRKKIFNVSLAFLFVAAVLSLFLFYGCAARQKAVTGLPVGVTQAQVQNWDTAVANLDKISQVTSTLRQSVIALNNATVTDGKGESYRIIPDGPTYAAILNSIAKVDLAQMDAATFLRAQPKNWGASTQAKVKNDIALITSELQTITQQFVSMKNPSAVSQLQQLISQISSAAAVIVALI